MTLPHVLSAARVFLLSAGRIFALPLSAIGVVILKPEASDLWLLSGVILGMTPAFAAVRRNSPARVAAKLSGSFVMGMACPIVLHRIWQDAPLVQDLSRIGWIWVAFGFVCGLSGGSLVRAVLNLFAARVIKPMERLAGQSQTPDDAEAADVFKPDTSVPPESTRAPKRRDETTRTRHPGSHD